MGSREARHIGGMFGASLRSRRRQMGLTLKELGRRSGLYGTILNGWELSRNLPRSARQVEKVEVALGLEPGSLMMHVASDRQARSGYRGKMPGDVGLAFRQVVLALRRVARAVEALAARKKAAA